MKTKILFFLHVILLFNNFVFLCEAQCSKKHDPETIGGNVQINGYLNPEDQYPQVTSIGKEGLKYAVTWYRNDTSDDSYCSGICAQLFDSKDGTKIGEEFRVDSGTTNEPKHPSITSIGAQRDKFVICWESFLQNENDNEIYAQVFNSTDHSKIGLEFRVNQEISQDQFGATIGAIGENNEQFVICWNSYNTEKSWEIRAMIYDIQEDNIVNLTQELQVNTFTNSVQKYPAVASIQEDGSKLIITWQSSGQDGSKYGIYAQAINSSNGAKIGLEFLVNSNTTNEQQFPSITAIGTQRDKFVICWQSYRQDGSEFGIYAQVFNSTDHSKIGLEFRVNLNTHDHQLFPSIAAIGINNQNNYFVITWISKHRSDLLYSVFARVFDSGTGNGLLDHDYQINSLDSYHQKNPNVAAVGNSFVVVWDSQDQIDGSSYEMYSQIFDSNMICLCSEGSFSNTTIPDQCQKCATGEYQSMEGQTSCDRCLSGTFQSDEGQMNCIKCPKGQYQPQAGQSACTKCKQGTYQNAKGQVECLDCLQGSYQNDEGQSACQECREGTFSNKSAQAECTNCPPGEYQGERGQSMCQICGKGNTANQNESATECVKCAQGTYQDQDGQTFCYNCPNGTYNAYEGSRTERDCLECAIGTYNDHEAQSSCQLCPVGTYQGEQAKTGCVDCLGGSYAKNEGSTSCELCGSGEYQNEKAQAQCQNCPFDTYQPNIGSSGCEYCPIFSETLSTKTQSLQECYCTIGHYGLPGESCKSCPSNGICNEFNQFYPFAQEGYWQSVDSPTEIMKCPVFEACPGNGFEMCNITLGYFGFKCSECIVGFYKLDSVCERCPENANQRLFFFLLLFLIILVFLLVIAKRATAYFGSFTISFSFFQLLVVLYQLNINWPTKINNTFKIFLPFNFNLDFLATECSFNFSYIDKWVIIQLSPFIFITLFVIIYSLLVLHSKIVKKWNNLKFVKQFLTRFPKFMYKPSKKIDNKLLFYFHLAKYYLLSPLFQSFSKREINTNIKNTLINVYLTLLTLLYLILSQKTLEIFDCQYDSGSDKFVFQQDQNYNCFESTWNTILPFAIISVILYIIGIPLLIIYLLIKNSKMLNEKEFDLKFGLLCSRYSKNFFFWEIIIMVRKLFFVICKIYLFNYAILQTVLIILVLLFALIFQFKYKPYLEKRHNFLEIILLSIPQLILFAGLVFDSEERINEDNLVNVVLFILVISIIILVLITSLDIFYKIQFQKSNLIKNINHNKISYFDSFLSQKKNGKNARNKNKKITLLLLVKWLSSLNTNKSKKIILLNNKICDNNAKSQKKINIKKKMILIKDLFENDLIWKICKWYQQKATTIQKLHIRILIENFYMFLNINSRNQHNIKN
ncbi:insulin-like growth factor binding protein [Anaeramoeba flamelloides]|uniref:Insulin-like growth factor binding protein n=1 Tax=Anaeramoeba flamelloides TaxID=1746091 RepID=A0ABQ8XHH7_9EUKA|nr:insulin-like growth factor binding protein [Anaeramoeba flamelloides]